MDRIDDALLVVAQNAPKLWQLFGGPARVTGVSLGFSARPHGGPELPGDAVGFPLGCYSSIGYVPCTFCTSTHDLVAACVLHKPRYCP